MSELKAPADRPQRRRAWSLPVLTLPGSSGAVVLACLSFTPSLLPRPGLYQGVVTGISAAIGYGLGVFVAWIWREFADRPARTPSGRRWRVFLVVAALALAVSAVLGWLWQRELRQVMGVSDIGSSALAIPAAGVLVFAVLLAIGRGLRWVSRRLTLLLQRRMGRRAARATGLVAVVLGTWLLVSGVLLNALVTAADEAFSLQNSFDHPGVEQPASALRSGGPDSLIGWESLGREGRRFAASGPSSADISALTGEPATEPIRVFAGMESADESEDRAILAVRDLERAGGFDREYLLVATTTGSGWLVSSSVDAFEYLTGGDSAIIGMQYSYLPSWISFLVDQERAREAGRDLFDAVYSRWLALPDDERPYLYVFGESLGSFGAETAFSGENDMANRTSGMLLVGPPSFNTLYREFTDRRDADSREIEPVYRGGRIVRFANRIADGIPPEDAPWDGTRVLYVLHPSDPVVWWSPDLIFRQPDWLQESPGDDVLDATMWIPVVTFWQLTMDLPMGMDAVPAGHGHDYNGEHVDAWAAILRIDDWDEPRLRALRQIVSETE